MSLLSSFIHGTPDDYLRRQQQPTAYAALTGAFAGFTSACACANDFSNAPALLQFWLRPQIRSAAFVCLLDDYLSPLRFSAGRSRWPLQGQDPMCSFSRSETVVAISFDVSRWPPLTAAIRTSCKTRDKENKRAMAPPRIVALRSSQHNAFFYLVNLLILLTAATTLTANITYRPRPTAIIGIKHPPDP
ncbi:hypothetical protein KCP78_19545 [Salmonella enterica subsp. enterica]|nr:hypothetical protein KCP78_19545 [Salmonella enterica subsp. enterica]